MNEHGQTTAGEQRALVPVHLLALAVLVLLGALLANTLRQGADLRRQLSSTAEQGRKAVDARLHFYNLYKDLFELSADNATAQAIVQKYKIAFNEPATNTSEVAP